MEFPSIYGFDTKIPVTIFGGECTINMCDIQEYMENVCRLEEKEKPLQERDDRIKALL